MLQRRTKVCGADDGSELGVGWGRLQQAHIPWTTRYDEVLTVFDGELRVHADGEVHVLGVRDSLWLPAGTELLVGDASLADAALTADTVINGVVGFAGLPVTLATLEAP